MTPLPSSNHSHLILLTTDRPFTHTDLCHKQVTLAAMYSQPYPPYSAYSTTPSSLDLIPAVSPVYIILLLGMVGFMLANFVPSMVEGGAEKLGWVNNTVSPRGPADAK